MLNVKCEFDRLTVEDATIKGQKEAFRRAGAVVRLTARRSIRTVKRPSTPGNPPHARGRRFKNSITYQSDAGGVVVGPVRFQNFKSTPAVLEYGGQRTTALGAIVARKMRADKVLNRQNQLPPRKSKRTGKDWRAKVHNRDAMIRRLRAVGKIGENVLTSDESREKKTFRIAPRPYMGPALNVNRAKITSFFRRII